MAGDTATKAIVTYFFLIEVGLVPVILYKRGMNGEIRDREKTMRGLKKRRTPILEGFQTYYNFVRPHMALHGKTPAEACGIKVEGDNKWMTLIQNASKKG